VRPDVLFHLAGIVTARPDIDLVLPTFNSLVASTINLLTAATDFGCRVVLVGSLTEPKGSEAEPTPNSPYSAAKWASSGYGRMFHQLYGTSVVIVRVFMTFGPRQHETKLIPYVIQSLLRNQRPELSSGRWEADWIYIEDVVRGLLAAAQVQGIEGSTVDLGSGTLVPVRRIVQHLVDLTSSELDPRFGALPDRPAEQKRAAAVKSTEALLGWKPVTPLIEGLRHTVDWYKRKHEADAA
jgi:nucleoside-diphosphate-sugar epimerase